MAESFKVESVVGVLRVRRVYKDAWSATVGTSRLYLLFQPQTVLSLGGPSSQVLAKCWAIHSTPYFAAPLATLAFSYMPHVVFPLSIMVSATGFILSSITSVRVDNIACVKDLLELGKTALLLLRLLSSFMHLSTLKYLNSAILLMPKVNILRVNFHEWQSICEIRENFPPRKNPLYGIPLFTTVLL